MFSWVHGNSIKWVQYLETGETSGKIFQKALAVQNATFSFSIFCVETFYSASLVYFFHWLIFFSEYKNLTKKEAPQTCPSFLGFCLVWIPLCTYKPANLSRLITGFSIGCTFMHLFEFRTLRCLFYLTCLLFLYSYTCSVHQAWIPIM